MTTPHLDNRIFVFVEGGAVVDVLNASGETVGYASVIDYDNEDNGDCPVCRGELHFEDGSSNHAPCDVCGYSENLDNALECAVKHVTQDDEALNG